MKRRHNSNGSTMDKRPRIEGIGLPLEIVCHIAEFLPGKLRTLIDFATCCKSHIELYTIRSEKHMLIPEIARACIGREHRCGCTTLEGTQCPYFEIDQCERQLAFVAAYNLLQQPHWVDSMWADVIPIILRNNLADVLADRIRIRALNGNANLFINDTPMRELQDEFMQRFFSHIRPRLGPIPIAGSKTKDDGSRAHLLHKLWILALPRSDVLYFARSSFVWNHFDFESPSRLDPRRLLPPDLAADDIEEYHSWALWDLRKGKTDSPVPATLPMTRYFNMVFDHADFAQRDLIVKRLAHLYRSLIEFNTTPHFRDGDPKDFELMIQLRLYTWSCIIERIAPKINGRIAPFALEEFLSPYQLSHLPTDIYGQSIPSKDINVRTQVLPLRKLYEIGLLRVDTTKLDPISIYRFECHISCTRIV